MAGLHRLLLFHPNGRGVLPPAQRRALDASLGVDGSADGSYTEASPFLLGLAVLTVLGDLSGSRLLVCLIDDAHWLDAESAQVLAFVARRLRNERILMLFAARGNEPAEVVFTGIPDLPVPPLHLDDAVELLLAAAGDIPLDRRVARQIAATAEGNPLAITEVGRELAARRAPPQVLLDEPLPVGARLRRHYETGIRRLPEDTRQLLLLAAANMGSAPGTLWRAGELAGIKESAAAPAERAALITVGPDLRFRHPLIRSAAYGTASDQEKRQAHSVLAAAARALGDRQAAAWQLAAATDARDETVAAELEAAAQSAHDRGSPLNESAFLGRAAELSPPGPRAVKRRLRAAEAALFGGAPLRAESLASQLPPDAAPADRALAEHLRVQARLATGRGVAEAPALLLDAALSCLKEAPNLAREILLEAVTATFSASQLTTTITPAELGERILTALGDDPEVAREPEELLLTGLATLLSGRYLTAAPLLREAIAALAAAPAPRERVPVWLLAATFAATAIWEDRFALEWLARCEDLARRTGAMRPLTLCLIGGSISNAARGQLALADQQTAEGRELARALGWTAGQLASFSAVRVLAYRGDRKALRRAFANGQAVAATRGSGDMIRVGFAAEITLHLGYGEYPEAYEAATAMRRAGHDRPDRRGAPRHRRSRPPHGPRGRSRSRPYRPRALRHRQRHRLGPGPARPFRRPAGPSGRSRRALREGHRPPRPHDRHSGPGPRPPALRRMAAPPPAPVRRQAPSGRGTHPLHRDGRHPVRRTNPGRTPGRGRDHSGTPAPEPRADRPRVPDRLDGRRRLHEPGDREPPVHYREHRGVPPQEGVQETGHRLPPPASRQVQLATSAAGNRSIPCSAACAASSRLTRPDSASRSRDGRRSSIVRTSASKQAAA